MDTTYQSGTYLISFLEDYKKISARFQKEKTQDQIFRLDKILKEFTPIYQEHLLNEKLHAPNFNIFRIIKISNLERLEEETHTPFLANLLSFRGSHCQQEEFYLAFLNQVKSKGIVIEHFIPKNFLYFFVETEKHTAYGNLDILLTNREVNNEFAICIENKIGAKDQPRQLERYYHYLDNSIYKNNILLVYLTISGTDPTENSINHSLFDELTKKRQLINLSYKQNIEEMLINSLNSRPPSNVFSVVNQYLQIIKTF